jgi:hypothetical protein
MIFYYFYILIQYRGITRTIHVSNTLPMCKLWPMWGGIAGGRKGGLYELFYLMMAFSAETCSTCETVVYLYQ